ncbi:MAG TPA: 2-oxo acid dehydrogenase subunit E2, partial [Pricia sp.]|nr:2-oxo acid dehydrogenase subunit E2 [Pricia sp.]
MSKFELKLPRMGESVAEATLTTWLKEVGDTIELDEPIFEIATDKVDSEVPSEVEGILVEKRFEVDDVVKVGQTVAVIEVKGNDSNVSAPKDKSASKTSEDSSSKKEVSMIEETAVAEVADSVKIARQTVGTASDHTDNPKQDSERFYSPLVKNIAKQEGISISELDSISGSGLEGRVTKNDILEYVANGRDNSTEKRNDATEREDAPEVLKEEDSVVPEKVAPKRDERPVSAYSSSGNHEVIEMTRMGKLVAKHMVDSVSTSAHVQSFIEVDVTNVVKWRNATKTAFEKREGEKLTFTPIFMEAVAKALKKYPMMNVSVDGTSVIKKKNINIGMAAALPDGNLIVPVIKNADQLNLVGMARVVNDLATRARENHLKPDEVQDGTYTVTNVGTFGSVFGTPIINQPQVGILALGAIRKMPSVIETPAGDFIGIRSKMYLSHSYD